MSDQHDIDNFFRNRFKDFESEPDPEVWNKISERLDEKEANEEKEGIVFLPWLYRAAGIAAAIALLFFAGNAIFNTNDGNINSEEQTTSTTKQNSSDENLNGTQNNSQITNTNNSSQENSSQKNNNTVPKNVLSNSDQIANENTEDATNAVNNSSQRTKENSVTQGNALQNSVAQQEGSNTTSQHKNNGENPNNIQNKNLGNTKNAVATTVNEKDKTLTQKQRKRFKGGNYKINGKGDYVSGNAEVTAIVENMKNGATNNTSNKVNSKGSEVNSTSNTIANKNAVAQNELPNKANSSDTNTTDLKSSTLKNAETTIENAVAATEKDEKEETIKRSILDVINDLHDLEENKKEVVDVPFSRWTISPNASPVYYNTLGNGSPIHESFEDNTKSGDINLSYGVNVGYDVSKRLTVRSGIHRVDYSYSTKDIAIVPSIDGPNITTIDFRANNVAFKIQDRQAPSNETFSQYQMASTAESSIFQKQIEGDLNQRMSFIEVPVEVKYAVLDKKIGINVIGGMSTLLLTENSIILDSPLLLTELGEATNVNDVSFSTNIGFGIDYKFSDQLEFNLEPMLKYQLNTFSRNTGNFNPYSVGIYTGVSFRF
ncbi:hypothetical protein KORDIASMS9_01286 [Kordia sp. SMS9]|uniref:hypothetical protein n=1 Tax=Kordia sp. SMS9 TaxID=2282170 RepID=UPI000E0CC564|nr:hypothetical protein [Kordia sp. SMS9]AXG69067.1 hypothetical protein KORDIASMS9_01286 [Kordia sp. SMS9]